MPDKDALHVTQSAVSKKTDGVLKVLKKVRAAEHEDVVVWKPSAFTSVREKAERIAHCTALFQCSGR